MKWSWRAGRIAGIDISIHATFPLLLVWVAMSTLAAGARAGAVVSSLLLVLAVFATVVLHELGHALTAKRYGIRTKRITLLPIGGVAEVEGMPRDPAQELMITLAGPAVNVVIAGVLLAGLMLTGTLPRAPMVDVGTGLVPPAMFVAQLMVLNVTLAAFNLLPAFPLDGGRVLRALLTMRYHDHTKATLMAARVGRAMALLFGAVGLLLAGSPVLVVIALFVWLAAAAEAAAVQAEAGLHHVPLSRVMITDVHTLAPDESLARAVELTISGFQQDFPVVERGEVVGMLSQRDLVRGLAQWGSDAPVRAAMHAQFRTATPEEEAEEALRRLTSSGDRTLAVVRDRALVGVLTAENAMEYVALHSAGSRSSQ